MLYKKWRVTNAGRLYAYNQNNPDKWNETESDIEHYFCEYDELLTSYEKDDFGQHFTLIDQRQALSFEYLEKKYFLIRKKRIVLFLKLLRKGLIH